MFLLPIQMQFLAINKMKSKLESIRKQNINNVANNILSANISIDKPPKREITRTKSVENDQVEEDEGKDLNQVIQFLASLKRILIIRIQQYMPSALLKKGLL